ncbi:alpha/beta fold hydrolase [Nonomuraea rubra]|uniref:alpha/beta fold hydrolase n=1 Tax=Nonomuraea rubra TaxID=46180 RepID=UPI003621079D
MRHPQTSSPTPSTLTDLTAALLDHLGVAHYAIYVQDYGAPIGWRLALNDPAAISAIITQNGNAYEAGFVDAFWGTVWDYQCEQTPQTEAAIREALTLDAIKWQYLTGVPDPSLVSPDTWHHDHALVSRPGNDRIQLALFRDEKLILPHRCQDMHLVARPGRPVLTRPSRRDASSAADRASHERDANHRPAAFQRSTTGNPDRPARGRYRRSRQSPR